MAAEQTEYLAVKCKACGQQFAVERVARPSNEIHLRLPSFKASYTCPHCRGTCEYTSEDLIDSLAGGEPEGV